ncbi:MAG: hypothetical protein AMXMBFR25_06620 [Lysobacterales bacterium]|nr:hypothetical protein [Xanthomonadales bacterium]
MRGRDGQQARRARMIRNGVRMIASGLGTGIEARTREWADSRRTRRAYAANAGFPAPLPARARSQAA